MPLSCIVFDCDGVILESVDAKNIAFGKVCDEFAPAHTKAFVDYVTLHGGVSRYEKFAWLVQRAEHRAATDDDVRVMAEKFHAYCIEAVLAAPLVPGFRETADRWLGKVPMYVASGTPHYELVEIIERHKLARYFKGVLGTPPAKASLLLSCVRDANARPEHCVMVGDSKTDLDAALVVGTKFYGRGAYFMDKPYPYGPDLKGLNAFLEDMQ
ncbi:MAG: Phosphoglycolate phosphatase [Desulfovibrio sp.]